jgi:hypothetical protein
MSIRGKYCSPNASTGSKGTKGMESCYTKDQLKIIADTYNKNSAQKIQIAGTKEQLWSQIDTQMKKVCDNEWCWIDKLSINGIETAFMPEGHDDRYQWLSTTEIKDVLSRYERIHKNFAFLGPMPIDFCSLTNNEICNIDINRCLKNGKTKIGMVFNTDPSTAPGKHWISMFIDISDVNPNKWEINFFDSFGRSAIPKEISQFIDILQKQNNGRFILKLNCMSIATRTCTNSVQHQQKGSECGVYSINFIVERLSGTTWEDFVVRHPLNDAQVNNLRTVFFRPKSGKNRHW